MLMRSAHGVTGRVARAAVIGVGMLVVLAPQASAQAVREGSFTCRGSVARVTTQAPLPAARVEPTIANGANDPCRDDSAAVLQPTTIGPLTVDAARAATDVTPNDPAGAAAAEGDRSSALAEVTNPVIVLGTNMIRATVLASQASFTCRNGQPVPEGTSQVANLTLNGNTIAVPQNNAPVTVTIPGTGITLFLNRQIREAGRITQRALEIETTGPSAALPDIVVAESIADITGNPCARAAQQPTPNECEDGRDNDGDGRIDFPNDPDCESRQDNSEAGPARRPQCSDGMDNDGDGRIDFPNDPDCESRQDNSEAGPGRARLVTQPSSIGRLGLRGSCIRRSFRAVVRGNNIRSVTFTLDGRRIGTVREAPFDTRVRTSRAGIHRLVARVRFTQSSNTSARTLRLAFRRCAQRPRFTG